MEKNKTNEGKKPEEVEALRRVVQTFHKEQEREMHSIGVAHIAAGIQAGTAAALAEGHNRTVAAGSMGQEEPCRRLVSSLHYMQHHTWA
jgi:hypothetical protein